MPASKAAERELKMGVSMMLRRLKPSLQTGHLSCWPVEQERTRMSQQGLHARW